MSRVHEVNNAAFALYNLAQRAENKRRDPDPFLLALVINLALAAAIAAIYSLVR